ncbi:Mov34/MPN/PAD-1 family protein [Nocardioides sp. WG-D5]
MTVHRLTALPQAISRGRLLVAENVIAPTRAALLAASTAGEADEGLVLWLGRNDRDTSIILSCATPRTTSSWGSVSADESTIGSVMTAARQVGLGVLAQVHSHPGWDTRHSDGDDELVFMPYEAMFSLVVGEYGAGSILPEAGAGLHQYQDGRWVQVTNLNAFVVVPPMVAVTA